MNPPIEVPRLIAGIEATRELTPEDVNETARTAALSYMQRLRGDDRTRVRDNVRNFLTNMNEHLTRNATAREAVQALSTEAERVIPDAAPVTAPTVNPQAESARTDLTETFDNIQRAVQNTLGFLPAPALRYLLRTFRLDENSWFGRTLLPEIQRSELMTKLREEAGKRRPPSQVVTTADDARYFVDLRTAHREFNDRQTTAAPRPAAAPTGSSAASAAPTPAATAISFEAFYTARITAAVARPSINTAAGYSLQDVVEARTPAEQALAPTTTPGAPGAPGTAPALSETARRQQLFERARENARVGHAVFTFALAKAMIRMNAFPSGLDTDMANTAEIQADLNGRSNDANYHYLGVRAKIINWLKASSGRSVLGIEIDGGDLEETDGSNRVWDNDIITHFEENLHERPAIAVMDLINPTILNAQTLNPTAARRLPELQSNIRAELTSYIGRTSLGETATPAVTPPVVAAAPAAAPATAPAAGPTPAVTPNPPRPA